MSDDKYSGLRKNFIAVCKRVLKEDLTTNPNKHREYLTDIVGAYNSIIKFVHPIYASLDNESKAAFSTDWEYYVRKIKEFFTKLNVTAEVPTDTHSLLSVTTVLNNYNTRNQPTSDPIQPEPNAADATPGPSNLNNTESQKTLLTKGTQFSNFQRNRPLILSDSEIFLGLDQLFTPILTMSQDPKLKYVQAASQMLPNSFSGDPLALQSFIDQVNLLKTVTADDLKDIFLQVVIGKLQGKARECIPVNPNSIDEVIDALKANIAPDNSKVVAGRLLALRVDRSKLTEFTEQAEKLAEALQRSLVVEGIPQAKAREMSIEKTVEVCRNAARSDLVKSVLAATKFDSPKEVVAKYVVESATEEKEKQILAYRTYQRQNNRNNKNNRGRNGNGRGGKGNRYNNNGGRNYSNNNNNSGNYGRNGNGNNSYNGGRNNNNGGGNRNNRNGWNNNRTYNNDRNNGENRNVRFAENYEAPQVPLGAVNYNN